MKLIIFAIFLLSLTVLTSCSSTAERSIASACKNNTNIEYHSYFTDYERCSGDF